MCETESVCLCACVYLCVVRSWWMDVLVKSLSQTWLSEWVGTDCSRWSERGRRLGELQQVCPPPRGKWRAEERKRDFKVWGKRKEEGFSVSPLKLNVCSGYLERFTISSTHGYSTHLPLLSCPAVYSVQLDTAAQDNRGGTTELKSVVKLSEVAAGQLIGNLERVFRIVFYKFLNASKLTCFQ